MLPAYLSGRLVANVCIGKLEIIIIIHLHVVAASAIVLYRRYLYLGLQSVCEFK